MPVVARLPARQLGALLTRLCVGRSLPDEPLGQTRAFVFTLATLLTTLVCSFYFVFFLAVGRTFDGFVMLGLVPLTLLNTLQCRRPGGLDRAVIGLAVTANVLILYLVYREGGVGPTSWWLIVPPYMLVNCSMHRASIVTLVVNVLVEAALLLTNRYGTPLASDLGAEPELLILSSRIGLAIVVLSSMIVLDRSRTITFASLRRANSDLAAASAAALAAAEAKARFLATMSHEIRTPLNGVMGASELLKRTKLDATQAHYLDTLQHSGGHLLELINNVLDFSKLEAGKATLEPHPFSLRALIEDVIESLAPRAQAKGLMIHAFIASDLPETVVGDALRLHQVIANLGANAVKFTAAGEVMIAATRIPPATATRCRIRLAVRDTGIGLEVEQSERLFQAFTQADGSTTRIYGGTGLGLAISNELVRMMGGAIRVDSTPGAGAEFSCELEFPLAADAAAPPALGGKVLLLDPMPSTRASLVETLRSLGTEVTAPERLTSGLAKGLAIDADTIVLVSARALDDTRQAPVVLAACRTGRLVLMLPYDTPPPGACADAPRLLEPVRREQLRATLAARWQPASVAPPSVAARLEQPANPVRQVLLVEDNPVNLEVAAAMLEQAGCEVDTAGDGREAIERWMRGHYELILMDCQMPVLDGLEATRGIRAAEASSGRPRCRIVALTANAFAEDRARCLEAGMDDFLAKPFTFAQLQQLVERRSAAHAD